ncbi:MAG: tyrosine-protein phosphatase [Pseudomonadota bacterium]
MNNLPDPDSLTPAGKPPTAPGKTGWNRPLTGRLDRLRAWVNMIFIDHAFFRMAYLNLHRLSADAWRAAQPLPYQITRLARKKGLKSIVSLRGGQGFGSLALELEACKKSGVSFEIFGLRSRALPTAEEILAADKLFQEITYPVLFHCKSGADRAGIMSALFLILREAVPVSQAKEQLSLRFGHIRQGKTGVLDAMFDAYLADQPDETMPFLEWTQTRYDPDAITNAFQSGQIGAFLSDTVLRRE